MAQFFEKFALAAARRRSLLRILGPILPETAELEVHTGLKICLDLRDFTGPSFYLNYGGPAAFYHYEETEKAEILRHLPAHGVFLDIGANIGLFSLFFARYFPDARIFAFEPHPRLAGCLNQTRARNGLKNLWCQNVALGASASRLKLHLHTRNSGGHSLLRSQITDKECGSSVEVEVDTLDAFVKRERLDRVDALKIDVQGSEWDVFAGGTETLGRFRPAILVEVENDALASPTGQVLEALKQLKALGYRLRAVGEKVSLTFEEGAQLAQERLRRGELQSNYVLTSMAT